MSAVGTNEQAATLITQLLEWMGVFDEESAEMFKTVAQAAMEKVGGESKKGGYDIFIDTD